MTTRSQAERQQYRSRRNGQYEKVNPCYGCGRSAGVNYFSHELTDCKGSDGEGWGDSALCLCGKCAKATAHMTTVSEFNAYRKAHGGA